ncbi:hypothetical protein K701_25440 [Streptomyces fradiae ATCC 10745 = DSM 40063]|uniref:DNA-binding phage zinc finger domain-containing protein n=1 Tax=Streptomyces fradiae ATCC 10745 = DSM 40063 TaxID=1319510 RepID=A0A1Y2NTQ3_STRFR|nr:hypothetical protein K701_25440 [Streptomyces fradiae ATCC 10745 = DSM 40063]OSY50439.1 hypothetical protein BG846_03917 [Streptomyces fradiae ATCC 10745 = DSM 40063]QEV12048.1 hypothetical protein CP974_08470 [Streptomyces fradiae ATCC 10745 = DSM 40063]
MTGAPRPAGLGGRRDPALAVACPHCRTAAGQACVIPANGRRTKPHPSRTAAAQEARTAA